MSKTTPVEEVLFPAFDYKLIQKSIISDADRIIVKLNPDAQTSTYNPRQTIKFNFPANGFMDLKNSTLNFHAKSTGTSGFAVFNPFIECLLAKVKIYTGSGSDIIENLLNYNLQASCDFKFETSYNYGSSIAFVQQGYCEDLNTRQTLASDGSDYTVNLLGTGLFGGKNLRYLPMGLLAQINGYNRSLMVEIELEIPSKCMQNFDTEITEDAALNYELSNVYFNIEIINAPSYETKLIADVRGGKTVVLPLVTSDLEPSQIFGNRTGNINFAMMKQKQFVQGVKTVFVEDNRTQETPYTWSWASPNNLKNYQYQIQNKLYPPEPVTVNIPNSNVAFSHTQLMKYYNKLKDYQNGTLLSARGDFFKEDQSQFENSFICKRFIDRVFTDGNNIRNLTANFVDITFESPPWQLNTPTSVAPIDEVKFDLLNADVYFVNMTFVLQLTLTDNTAATAEQFTIGLHNGTNFVDNLHKVIDFSLLANEDKTISITIAYFTNAPLLQADTFTIQGFLDSNNAATTVTVTGGDLQIWNIGPNTDSGEEKSNFAIAQTFKTFYDQDEYALGAYMIDGISTMQNSAIMLNMDIGAGQDDPTNNLSVFNFIDYLKMIVIDKDGVSLIQ